MCTIEYCYLLYFKEDGNESYVALSGDFSIIPEMEYLVIAYAWGLQRLSFQIDYICLKGRKASG